jgi:hypothetical protein
MSIRNRLERLCRDRSLRTADSNGTSPDPPPFPIRTVADVLALLEEQIHAIRVDEEASAVEKARTSGYLAGIALRAIETGNLAARIEMLEMVLKQRNGDGKQ